MDGNRGDNQGSKPNRRRCRVLDDSRFSQWLDDTTIHGIKHVFKAPSLIRNIFWGILFFVAACSFLITVVNSFVLFVSRPTATTISLDTDTSTITFPAVTICNLNPVRLSYARENNLTSLLTYLYGPFENLNSDCATRVAETNMANKTLRQIMLDGHHTLRNFVLSCSFSGGDSSLINCTQNLTLTLTNLGYCYSFNSLTSAPEVTVSNSGARYGLSLLLDIQQEEYLPLFGSAGVRVAIQPRGVPPEPDERGILIPPGEEGLIELRAQIVRDGSTRRTCSSNNAELNFFRGYEYSLSACRLDRTYQVVADRCKCLDLVNNKQSVTNPLPDCTLSEICCTFGAYFNVDVSNCTEACAYTGYVKSTSYSEYPSDNSAESVAEIYNITAEQVKNNLVAVTVYFGDPHTRTVETEDSFTVTALLSKIGGQFGLFLGASVISMIELGVFTFDELVVFVKKCLKK